MALTQLTTLKDFKKDVESSDSDAFLNKVIGWASGMIESACNRKFGEATYTEYYNGDEWRSPSGYSRDRLILKQYPVISVTSLHDDTNGDFGSGTLIDTSDYEVVKNCGFIVLKTKRFVSGVGNIKVAYDAGYKLPGGSGDGDDLPTDIELACLELVCWVLEDRGRRVGVSVKNIGDGGSDSLVQDWPISTLKAIQTHRRRNV